ncbi:hypothetical protein ACET3X_008995 [Alternaria dauci]|uniref:Uncharacterized protein n=1 Tax=Alternaria dauci TaxID=48095 RepID=A0ABR3U7L7_9PLEO
MPFHDREWEELQRDCDIFPAYSDFIFGPDERLVVTQEPGLHPMIYPTGPFAPIRYTNSMPSRSWSYKTTEGIEKSKRVAAQWLLAGQNEPSHSDTSGLNSGRVTPGLGVGSQIGNPLNPLLPTQSDSTVSEKTTTRRKALNTSQRRRQSQTQVPSSPLQQQQPVRTTRQQMHTRTTPVIRRSDLEPQQPSFLRSSPTTDIDENPAHMGSHQKPDMLSPLSLQPTMLPPPADLSQQQSQRAPGLRNNLPPNSAPNASPELSQQSSLLQPNDLIHHPCYTYFKPAQRSELARVLSDCWNAARNPVGDDALKAKAISDIRNITMMVNNSFPSVQAAMDMQQQRVQQPQMHVASVKLQTDHMQRIQQRQPTLHTLSGDAHSQPQPGVWSPQPTQSSPSHSFQQPASEEPYYSIPQASPQMQLPQQSTTQGVQTHHQPQQQAQGPFEQRPTQNSPQNPAQLYANINRYIPRFWQCYLIVQNTSQPMQYREEANQWMLNFKDNLPIEGRAYFVQVMKRVLLEHRQGRDALAFLKMANPESDSSGGNESKQTGM